MLSQFLSRPDDDRASHAFAKLDAHQISNWCLTGGLAIEIHHIIAGHQSTIRPLNDIDFIAASFADIPESLAGTFLFRHIHPQDPPNKTMLQMIDPDTAVRIDVFRACGRTMSRAIQIDLCGTPMQLISQEDLLARTARLTLDLAVPDPMPAKHAKDFVRLLDLRTQSSANVETAWQDHRKPAHPATFEEAAATLLHLIPASANLLITPTYSKDTNVVCPRCAPTGTFPLADPNRVLALFGYC